MLMNLLQNAVEACKSCLRAKSEAFGSAWKGRRRPARAVQQYQGKPGEKRGDRLLSDKPQAQEHRLRACAGSRAIKKYGGDMEIEYSAERFSVWAVLPLNGGEKKRGAGRAAVNAAGPAVSKKGGRARAAQRARKEWKERIFCRKELRGNARRAAPWF